MAKGNPRGLSLRRQGVISAYPSIESGRPSLRSKKASSHPREKKRSLPGKARRGAEKKGKDIKDGKEGNGDTSTIPQPGKPASHPCENFLDQRRNRR